MDATNLAELYGTPLVDWQRVEARLDRGIEQAPGTAGPGRHTCWLATTNTDGSPHLTGIGALWLSGVFYFETGETTRKGRNLARNPRCSLSVATDEFDLVVDGEAALVDEPDVVADLAGRWDRRGVAGQGRRNRYRTDSGVQRAVRGAAAVAGLPAHASAGDGCAHRRARRGHPVAVLTAAPRSSVRSRDAGRDHARVPGSTSRGRR
jgi:hypothetical protein